jgi:catechol 2,3-dioxygenase-like lactoylglutathione lyase family enzyme
MLNKSDFVTMITIKNMDRAIEFYTKKLGGKVQMRADGEMKDMWASLRIGKEEFWLIKPPGRQPKKPDLAYSAFVVKNVKKEVSELQKKGVKFQRAEKMDSTTEIDGAVATDPFGSTAFFNDSEGNLLMLWQTPGK